VRRARDLKVSRRKTRQTNRRKKSKTRPRRDSLSSPYWIEDERLGNGKVDFLKATEITFWQNMIKKYLLPFTPSPVEQAKQKKELSEYRDSFIFTFVLINILYITLVIMLQIGVDLKVPWTVFERFDVHGEDGIINEFEYKMPEEKGSIPEVKIIRTNVDKLDVIGLFFLAMFSSVVFAQMIGMILHRWQTLCQYIASTKLRWVKEGEDNSVDEVMKVAHEFVEQAQAPVAEETKKSQGAMDRRKTISALVHDQRKTGGRGEEIDLERQFRVTFENPSSFENPSLRRLSTRRGTMAVLANRRASYINNERRRSSVGFTSLQTRESSMSSAGFTNQGYEADSVFDEEDGFSDSMYSDRRTLGRNSVQFDVSTNDFQQSRV